jgi:hypothetical protein
MYYFPPWIYEALPYLYLLVGTTAAAGVDPTAGRISGLLLITAAIIILKLRRDNRRVAKRPF